MSAQNSPKTGWLGRVLPATCFAFISASLPCLAAEPGREHGLELGTVTLESVGPMAFATKGILLIGDPKTASVYAVDTEDMVGSKQHLTPIKDVARAIGKTLQASGEVSVGELAVNPETGNAFLSVEIDGAVQLVKIDGENTISRFNWDKVPHASKVLPNPPVDKEIVRRGRTRNARMQSITDLAYFDGKVLVTGLSADDSPSRVMEMPFPFADNSITTSVEIFHAAHGRVEDAPIQTFLPMVIDGEANLLAGFTCTPLVRFQSMNSRGSQRSVAQPSLNWATATSLWT